MSSDEKPGKELKRVVFGPGDARCKPVDFRSLSHNTRREYSEQPIPEEAAPEEEPLSNDEITALLEQARKEGYAEGFVSGRRAARQEQGRELEAIELRWKSCLTELSRFQREVEAQVNRVAFSMARELAEHVLHAEVKHNPEMILPLAQALIRNAMGLGDVVLSVAPEFVDFLEERLSQLELDHPEGGRIEVKGDPRLDPGSCRLFSSQGQIDGLIKERLELLSNLVELHLIGDEEEA